jgi:hypothetical protein
MKSLEKIVTVINPSEEVQTHGNKTTLELDRNWSH